LWRTLTLRLKWSMSFISSNEGPEGEIEKELEKGRFLRVWDIPIYQHRAVELK